MPVLDGYQMALKIKTLICENNLQMVPIISQSSNEISEQELLKQRKFRIDGYLTKPAVP